MFIQYRTQGFILKKEDRGEADKILTVYTKDFGKLRILGKAIRKIQSKLRGGVRQFSLSETEFIQGKTYKTLIDSSTIENFKNLRKDLKKIKIAYQITDVLDNLVRGEEKDEKIWDLLNETFQKLNNCQLSIVNCQSLYYYFLWNVLSILGYEPQLYNCIFCQERLAPGKFYFNSGEGGIICLKCFKKIQKEKISVNSIEINLSSVKILRIILKRDFITLSKLKIEPISFKILKNISDKYLFYISGLDTKY
jgi:DNA repair protein RecO (recombination protein O)